MNKRMSKKRGHSHGHCVIGRMRISPVFSFQVLPLASWASPSPISTFFGPVAAHCSERSAIHNLNLRSLVLNGEPDRRDLLARLGRVRVRDPLGSPVLIYYLYPNDLLVLRRDVHYSTARVVTQPRRTGGAAREARAISYFQGWIRPFQGYTFENPQRPSLLVTNSQSQYLALQHEVLRWGLAHFFFPFFFWALWAVYRSLTVLV